MSFNTFLIFAILVFSVTAAPTGDTAANSDEDATYEVSEEVTTPHPDINENSMNKTIPEQHAEIYQCWEDAAIGHGPDSADRWIFGKSEGTRKTKQEDCDKITKYFKHCHCFFSIVQYGGKKAVLKYYVYTGAYESEVKYLVTKENGL